MRHTLKAQVPSLVRRAGITLVAFAAAGLMLPAVAQGTQGPKTAYQATYEYSGPTGGSTNTMWCDGKGHIRSEQTVNGMKVISIMDFPNKVMYSIQDAQKTIMKMPLDTSKSTPDEDFLKKMKAQKLPPKVIDGHPCTGWRYTAEGHTTELWNGSDTDCAVLQTQDGKTVQKLKAYQKTNPPASMFALPSGYKTMDMAAMMQQAQQYNKSAGGQ